MNEHEMALVKARSDRFLSDLHDRARETGARGIFEVVAMYGSLCRATLHRIGGKPDGEMTPEEWAVEVAAAACMASQWMRDLDSRPDANRFCIEVASELRRARAKHPNPAYGLIALGEEIGELASAISRFAHNRSALNAHDRYMEAVQVAAVACRVATETDASLAAVPYKEP